MKKFFICLSIFLFSTFCFANKPLFTGSLGISTSLPVYGSEQIKHVNDYYFNNDGNRIIVGTSARLELNAINPFVLFVDADLNMDFNFSDQQFFHMMDLAFTGGMKFYPGLGGFAFGIGYSIGTRFDFYNDLSDIFSETEDSSENVEVINSEKGEIDKNDWGNGFKLFLEYDFSYNSSYRFLPTLGVSWRLMPRGNNFYDNIFSFYLMMNF